MMSAPPSLRTGQAGFPHPALQSVVLPPRGLTNRLTGYRERRPGAETETRALGLHFPPREGRQHADRPKPRL